ncbi:MAG: DNA translocase FtsK [Ruminococcaceae bacterium]|nr:DNA translocase FtsK [Oscillospiraceae bacterium]
MAIPAAAKQGEVFHVKKRRLTELDIPVSGPSDSVSAAKPEPFGSELTPAAEESPAKGKGRGKDRGRPKTALREEPVEKDPDTGWAADAFRAPEDLTDPVQAELASSDADSSAVDEKIFDEVMRRTRERIGKNMAKEENAPLSGPRAKVQTVVSGGEPIPDDHASVTSAAEKPSLPDDLSAFAGDAFDADRYLTDDLPDGPLTLTDDPASPDGSEPEFDAGIDEAVNAAAKAAAARAQAEKQKFSAPLKITGPSDRSAARSGEVRKPKRAEPNATDTASLVSEVAENDDISDLFLNPEDAELLDRLSEQYRNPLEVKRETLSAPEPEEERETAPAYCFPPTELLTEDPGGGNEDIKDELQENAVKLVDTLKSFKVNTKIENISRGPTITRYELVPEPGTKVRSITNLVDDIALNLATTGVRIEAPIPGKSAVGIEVPNKKRTTVHLRTLLETEAFRTAKSCLTVALGEDVAGDAVYFDAGKMPHLLIAGTTGSGKSVCINTIIMSLLYKASPDDVKMILIDPKKVELNIYNGIPHLLVPVVSEPKKAAGSLSWAVSEMERRYGLIEDAGKRNIGEYNKLADANPEYEHLPSIVIIIDELADLMMTAPDDVEDSICRIAQKARAAGMYLIVGTQRPSVDVITGLIKANIPSRIAFRTSNQVDSRTIIDIGSAANLIGMGDMLFAPVGAMKPNRVQGAFVSEDDVMKVVSYIRNMNNVAEGYNDEIVNQIEREAQRCGAGKKGSQSADDIPDEDGGDEDPMLKPAIEVALDAGKISTSLIQRRLKLGYGRAAKLIDRMEQLGYVSAPNGPHPREVLLTRSQWQELNMRDSDPPPFDL